MASTRGIFKVSCETQLGEDLYIIGSIDELGGWDTNRALRLHTSGDDFPVWSTDVIEFSAAKEGLQTEYKYIKHKGGEWQWESFPSNRCFVMPAVGSAFTITDGAFNVAPDDKGGDIDVSSTPSSQSVAPASDVKDTIVFIETNDFQDEPEGEIAEATRESTPLAVATQTTSAIASKIDDDMGQPSSTPSVDAKAAVQPAVVSAIDAEDDDEGDEGVNTTPGQDSLDDEAPVVGDHDKKNEAKVQERDAKTDTKIEATKPSVQPTVTKTTNHDDDSDSSEEEFEDNAELIFRSQELVFMSKVGKVPPPPPPARKTRSLLSRTLLLILAIASAWLAFEYNAKGDLSLAVETMGSKLGTFAKDINHRVSTLPPTAEIASSAMALAQKGASRVLEVSTDLINKAADAVRGPVQGA